MADTTIVESVSIGPGQSINATRNVDSLGRPLFLAIGVDDDDEDGS